MRMRWVASSVAVALWVGMGFGSAVAGRKSSPPPPKFQLTTPAFADGTTIPTKFSCVNPAAVSLPLEWGDPPAGTKSLAVIMHDADYSPGKGSMDVTHWIFWDVPVSVHSIAAGVKPGTSPDGMRQGKNTHMVEGYLPVCPPPGAFPHHYIIELFALDTTLDLPAGASRSELLSAMNGHVIAKSAYFGRFGR